MIDDKRRVALLRLKAQPDIKVEVPGFKGAFEPHQRVGVAYGVVAGNCMILDFVGAGKTWEAIGIDAKHRSRGQVYRTLVACQGNKVKDWKEEFQNLTDLPLVTVRGNKQQRVECWLAGQANAGVTIAHYEVIRGDFMERIQGMKGINGYQPSSLANYLKWDMIIFDEISILKNISSVLSQSAQLLSACSPNAFKLGLDATPVQKTYQDIHSIMEVIEPGLLGTRWEFENKYIIKKTFETYSGRGRKQRFDKVIGYKNDEELAHILAPYFIRREKHEVYGDKLKHVPKVVRVQLTDKQLAKYKELAGSAHDNSGRNNLLQIFSYMEKACDTMAYFDKADHTSAKLEDLRFRVVDQLRDEKIVIFSKTKLPLKEIQEQILIPEGIGYIRYTGDEDQQERDDAKDRFMRDPRIRIALVTTAAERGMNLHAAHYMIFYNHLYNQARTQQIMGRIDRPIVQQSNFYCTLHYIAEDTFEENIIPRFKQQADLASKVFGASNLYQKFDDPNAEIIEALNTKQLLELIKTGHFKVDQPEFEVKP